MTGQSTFGELHVVSDLHMGGASPDKQIFNQAPALSALIKRLADRSPKAPLALCINGDIVDFLACPDAVYLDTENAVRKLEDIFEHESFKPVWEALAGFLKRPAHRLVLVLGNHDVELALPSVRDRLIQRLAGDDAAARGRLVFATDGTGFSCRVGNARVLCLHGNEVDAFNAIDHSDLHRVKSALNRSRPVPDWQPNAGTRLVIDLLNHVKKDHAWVDLLKPETRPVFGLLATVEPRYLAWAARLAPVLARATWDSARLMAGFLGDGEAEAEVPAPPMQGETLDEVLALSFTGSETIASERALLDVVEEYSEDVDPLDIIGVGGGDDYLGLGGALVDLIRGRDPAENVREALLEWLREDRTFDLRLPDRTFKKIAALVGPEVDFVLAGHTHLQRALPLPSGGMYYNTGTWIRLIQIDKETLKSKRSFSPVWKALKDGSLEVLDKHQVTDHVRTVASIKDTPGGVVGTLSIVRQVGGAWKPEDIDGSRHMLR